MRHQKGLCIYTYTYIYRKACDSEMEQEHKPTLEGHVNWILRNKDRHKEPRQKPVIRDGTCIQGDRGKGGVMPSPKVLQEGT